MTRSSSPELLVLHPLFDERDVFELRRLERRLLKKIGNDAHVLTIRLNIGEAERKSETQWREPSGRYFSAMPLGIILVGLALFFIGDLLV